MPKFDVHGEMVVPPEPELRDLTVEESKELTAGDRHYRAYVGPPDRYDFMGATQFALLFHLGLRDHHKVLDFGCGSIRLGRLLIPFLRPGGYHAIDPNKWLIEDGFARELGPDIRALKQPSFSHNSDFDCTVFGECFDFNIAQSIITHMGEDLVLQYLDTARQALTPTGLIAFTYVRDNKGDAGRPADGWHYPGLTRFTTQRLEALARSVGLVGRTIPWFHPRTFWFVAAHSHEHLPATNDLQHLSGAVLRDEQFRRSRNVRDIG